MTPAPNANRPAEPAAPPLWSALLVCALVAAWVDFGTIHRLHNGDSLVYVVISLHQWSPFLWETDRFGMLVPLLALPFRHPLANLLVQTFLTTFAALATIVLLSRLLRRDVSYALVAAGAGFVFLAFGGDDYPFEFFIDGPYAAGLSLMLAAFWLVEPSRRGWRFARVVLAALLAAMAHWVMFSTALILGPVVALRYGFDRRAGGPAADRLSGREAAADLALLAVGAGVGAGLMQLSPYRQTQLGTIPVGDWPGAWKIFFGHAWEASAPHLLPLAVGLLAVAGGVVLIARPEARRRAAPTIRGAAAFAIAALAIALFLGTKEWMRANEFAFRYLVPSVVLLLVAGVAVGVAAVLGGLPPRTRRALEWAAPLALLGAATWSFGPPSPSGVRAEVDRRFGGRTADLLDSGCTHLAGDFWRVWPSVFHADLALYERGERRVIWGITHRCAPTAPLWMSVPTSEVRVGIPVEDDSGESWMRAFRLPPFVEVERRPTIRVLRPASAGAAPR